MADTLSYLILQMESRLSGSLPQIAPGSPLYSVFVQGANQFTGDLQLPCRMLIFDDSLHVCRWLVPLLISPLDLQIVGEMPDLRNAAPLAVYIGDVTSAISGTVSL